MVLFTRIWLRIYWLSQNLRQPTSTPNFGPQPVYFLHGPAVAKEFVSIALYLKFYDLICNIFYFYISLHSLAFNISHCKNKSRVYHFLLHPVRIIRFPANLKHYIIRFPANLNDQNKKKLQTYMI